MPTKKKAARLEKYSVEVYRSKDCDWRWRVWSDRNDKIVADSAEGYRRLDHATRMARTLFPTMMILRPFRL